MIGHDTLTPEERAYQDECNAFLAEQLDPELVVRMDRSEVLYPTEFIAMMGEHHYLGACVPAAEGGGGRAILEDALLNERVGYHGSAALACARTFTSHVGWILAVDRLLLGIALGQSNDLSISQIDGREDGEGCHWQRSAKLRRIARPTRWLFSG